ncbi:MAG: radical SAM protein [Candidatus Thorarchaeota archaeon]
MFDLSFIPSYKCNLNCWFCMYDCGPDKIESLDINNAKYFIDNLDLSKIHMFGFYGGEVSVDKELYQKFIDLTPENIPRFTITNGSWSSDKDEAKKFLKFIYKNKLDTKISNTKEHRNFQDREFLNVLIKYTKPYLKMYIKENDDTKSRLLPMGRLSRRPFSCSKKCTQVDGDLYRIAMEPNGNIIFQNCDGVYPVVGNYKNTLEEIEERIYNIIEKKEKDINDWISKVLEEE